MKSFTWGSLSPPAVGGLADQALPIAVMLPGSVVRGSIFLGTRLKYQGDEGVGVAKYCSRKLGDAVGVIEETTGAGEVVAAGVRRSSATAFR